MKRSIAALCFELPHSAESGASPAELTLIPAPDASGWVRGIDGRAWRLPNPQAVVAAFTRRRAITENHARTLLAPQGGAAPAFGWITAIAVAADGSITGTTAWTPRGKAALDAEDYGYLSPEFEHDADGNILAVLGAALTNDPNFPQLALNAEGDPTTEHDVTLKAIAEALGLNPAADEASVLAAVQSLKTERQTALNAAQHPDPARFVPAEQHQVALNAKQAAETALAAIQAEQAETAVVQAVDAAVAAGKVVPATRDYFLAMCRAQGGLKQFEAFVATAPVIAAPGAAPQTKPDAAAGDANGLSAAELAICAATGIAPKDFAAARAA